LIVSSDIENNINELYPMSESFPNDRQANRLTLASSCETPLLNSVFMSAAILLVWVFWYRSAYSMTIRSLFQAGTPESEIMVCTLCGYGRKRVWSVTTSADRAPVPRDKISNLVISARMSCETLLHLPDFHQLVSPDQPTQFSYERDMFANVSAKFPELRIFLHELLHIRYGIDGGRGLSDGARLIGLDIIFQRRSEVSKRFQKMSLEKWICRGRESYLLQWRDGS
jgi:hypothetical protein